LAVHFGKAPTLYANLSCPSCGADLREAARAKLVELFSDVPTDRENRRLMGLFVALCVPPMVATGAMLTRGGRGPNPAWMAAAWAPLVLMPWVARWFTTRVHARLQRCDCGRPAYKFMGMLGRSYCYRCSSCGVKLKLRD
jgi:hypothetical protein